jgi:hypothetical protein
MSRYIFESLTTEDIIRLYDAAAHRFLGDATDEVASELEQLGAYLDSREPGWEDLYRPSM